MYVFFFFFWRKQNLIFIIQQGLLSLSTSWVTSLGMSWNHILGAWKDFAILASLSATPFHLCLTCEKEIDSKYNAMHCESSMIWPKGARHGGSIFMDFTTFSEPLSRTWFRVPWQKTPLFDTPKLQQRLQCVAEVFFLITDQLPYPIRLVSPRRFLLFESCGIWHYQNLLWGWDTTKNAGYSRDFFSRVYKKRGYSWSIAMFLTNAAKA